MSTQVELMPTMDGQIGKMDEKMPLKTLAESDKLPQSQQHPLHQFDFKIMNKFFESCVGKLKEQNPKWKPTEWSQMCPMPSTLSWEQKYEWPNPQVFSQKQRVYEAFARLARESGEPMILMPSFDYGDLVNFDRFLQALKQDGVNAIGKYKQYLNYKELRKLEVDLVVLHARYGILLIEVRDCDHLDVKKRSRARAQLSQARSCFQSLARLIFEAKGWSMSEASIPIMELIAVPNMHERPATTIPTPSPQQANLNQSTSSSSGRSSRQMNFLIKSDLESSVEFAKWWTQWVVEPRKQQQQQAEAEQKVNKYDVSVMNWLMGMINCVRNNLIVPVVYPESTTEPTTVYDVKIEPTPTSDDKTTTTTSTPSTLQFQPALNVHAEFFTPAHEQCRSMSRMMVVSKCAEKIRKTICLQTMWMLLNDSQKKISVVCSEMNKQYYEEFFARQRKLYNNLNNVRFYSDLHSCAVNAQSHTLKKEGEIWFFDSGINGPLSDVIERVKELNAFWMFTTQEELAHQYKSELNTLKVKQIHLDETRPCEQDMPWLSGVSLKLPLRLQCDLLIIGDMIGQGQLKQLYRSLKIDTVMNQANSYNRESHGHYYHNHKQQQQQLSFNPAKKFKSIKFIRGGSIDNLRNSLKMHDSIQAPVIIMHVGDEDLFKTRTSLTTIERVKELATLVKEYCPKSFVVLSTLMRRMSKTENGVTNDVNKGIINFCKQTRETLNCHYMLNSHFEPEYHTQEGRLLSNKGLRLYMDNIFFVVDYFLIRNNKQH